MNLDLTYLAAQTLALPTQIWLRISTACDLRCPLCERQHIFPVDSGFMDFDQFERLSKNLAGVRKIHLFGLGEPFLNKRFFEFVQKCHAQGVETSTTTHAMRIDEKLARQIIESGLEELAISMDAAEPELFNRLREGSDFETVCRNVKYLTDLQKDLGAQTPQLVLCCAVSKENVHQLEFIVELAARLGIRQIFFSDLIAPTPDHIHYNISGTPLLENNLKRAESAGEKLGIKVDYFQQNSGIWKAKSNIFREDSLPKGCAMAWTNLVVERRGETKFCCYIQDPLPSAFDRALSEAMNSEGHLNLRQRLIEGQIPKECQSCPNLFSNSIGWVNRQLGHVEFLIENADLEKVDRDRLLAQVEEFRAKAERRFRNVPPSSLPKGIKHWFVGHIPKAIRRGIRSILFRQ